MITPILLCGGSGTRLWPLSRKSYPKQFVPLISDKTLFQASAERLSGAGYNTPLVLANSDFRFIVTEQLAEIGIDPGAILIEPESRNTAPAILAAALYLELSEAPQDSAIALKGFVEKPDEARAEEMVASGMYLWNAGIFLFSVATILAAFRTHAPGLMDPVGRAVTQAQADLGFLRLAPEPWAEAEDISIDYAIMERSDGLSVVPFSEGWSDLGGWDAVWRESTRDDRGVATTGAATAIDCDNTLLRSEDDRVELVGLGLKDIITVAMPDAVLVADASRAQDVKQAVTRLKAKSAKQATMFPKDHRPWGWFESLVIGNRFQVKRIHVHPGAALSLQSHHHRSEHWIVVEGTAKVTIDEEVKLVSENQSVYIPLGAVHRMENPGKLPMVLIEVQTGSYLGEDDIVRYEDIYARD